MVELSQVTPRISVVTRLATGPRLLHPVLELALVRVLVANGAGAVFEVINRGIPHLRCSRGTRFSLEI